MASDGTKYLYGPDLDTSSPLTSIDSSVTELFILNPGYLLFTVKNGALNDYYIFDESNLTSSASFFFESNMDNINQYENVSPVFSDGRLYFVSGAALYSKTIDTSGSATVFANNVLPSGATLASVFVTDNYIVVEYQQFDNASNPIFTIERIKKSDSTITTIVDGAASTAPYLLINSDNLAYTTVANNSSVTTSYLVDASGSVLSLSNSDLAGLSIVQTVSLEQSGIWAKNLIIEDTSGNLTSYDMTTLKEVAALGTVPTDTSNIFLIGFGDQMLGTGYFSDGGTSTQEDLFFVDLAKPSSLERLTNTPGVNETSFYL
jgi:hypothetical protein